MQAVGRYREDDIPFFDLLAIDDFRFFDHADDGTRQDIQPRFQHAGLLGGFSKAADREAVVEAAGVVDGLDELQGPPPSCSLPQTMQSCTATSELRPDHDDVIDQMMDHVVGDGTHAAVLEGDLLLEPGSSVFMTRTGSLMPGEGGVVRREAKSAGASGGCADRRSVPLAMVAAICFLAASAVSDGDAGLFRRKGT